MKKTAFICAALVFVLSLYSSAGEFKDKGEIIAVDFPAGWSQGKSDDPAITLKLERGKSSFEFSRQDSELSDYYLKARVNEQVDSLRGKGTSLSGEIRSVSLHGVSNAYYTSYESMGAQAYIAFFSYNGISYAVSVKGFDEGEFRGVIGSIRKPGEKIELPKPKKTKVSRRRKVAQDDDYSGAQIFKDGEPDVPAAAVALATTGPSSDVLPVSSAAPAAVVEQSTTNTVAAAAVAAQSFISDLAKKQESGGLPPYLPRKPLPPVFWGALIGLWVAGSFVAKFIAGTYKNPKLPHPPSDLPPDFFFPFLVSRFATMKDVTYNVLTRQKQLLLADFPGGHELYLAGSFYGCVFFHVLWSFLAFTGRGEIITNVLLRLPFGRAWASLPEVFFLVPFVAGVFMYFTRKDHLMVYDAQSSLVMEVRPEIVYGLIRDGEGKEVARLVRKGGMAERRWEFVDTDNLVVFSIYDDFPTGHLLRKFFGSLGGALRGRYGIFVQDRRAGYVFLDPSSAGRFQIHLDYAFARLAHPAQILAAVLYIISREKDPVYPYPF